MNITLEQAAQQLKNADNILVMTNNGIEESGTHKELIKKNGIYAKLYEMYSN